MYLIYHPEGSEDPTRFDFNPKKIMSAERESLEKRTNLTYDEFVQAVLKGSSQARRALLHMYLKRANPRERFEDVDFAWDELELKFHRSELVEYKAAAEALDPGAEREESIRLFDQMLEEAEPEADEPGKAPSNA